MFKKLRSFAQWLKRKMILIIAAFMIGMSNVIMEEDRMVDNSQNKIEQEQKDYEDNLLQ